VGSEVGEDLLEASAAQAGESLQGGLIDGPLAKLVGMHGEDDQEDEMSASFPRVLDDEPDPLMTIQGLRDVLIVSHAKHTEPPWTTKSRGF
jgi:hypothetical protein